MPEFMSILDLCSMDALSGFVLQSLRDWFVSYSFDSGGVAKLSHRLITDVLPGRQEKRDVRCDPFFISRQSLFSIAK
jgi:hypothetical protein